MKNKKLKSILKDYKKLNKEEKSLFKKSLKLCNYSENDCQCENPSSTEETCSDIKVDTKKSDYFDYSENECQCECLDTEELKYLNELSLRCSVALDLMKIVNLDRNPYLPVSWIAKNILKISPEDIEKNTLHFS